MDEKERAQFFKDIKNSIKIGLLHGVFYSNSLEDRVVCHLNKRWFRMYKPQCVFASEELNCIYPKTEEQNSRRANPQALSNLLDRNIILYQTPSVVSANPILIPERTYYPKRTD